MASGNDEKLVELFAGPRNRQNTHDLNVILVPDVNSHVGVDWSSNNSEPWPGAFFISVTPHVRIWEYVYDFQTWSAFSWTKLVDFGRKLSEVMRDPSLELSSSPLFIVAHGLGGVIVKKMLLVLEDGYHLADLRQQCSLLSGVIFLGTPHPAPSESARHQPRLDALLCSMKSLSKSKLDKIREEMPVLYNLSARFEGIKSLRPVWSFYEERPTKHTGFSIWKSKSEIIVDASFAKIGLSSEKLKPMYENHASICRFQLNSTILAHVRTTLRAILETDQLVTTLSQFQLEAASKARELWGSTTATSVQIINHEDSVPKLERRPSPAGATEGSQDLATYEVIQSPSKTDIKSELPAVKLPCRILGPSRGLCFDRNEVFKLLRENLLPQPGVTKTGLKTFALSGRGGIGKTSIAREFVSRHQDQFDAVFWVKADTESKLNTSFKEIALILGLVDHDTFGDVVISRNQVLNWLSNPIKHSIGAEGDAAQDSQRQDELANWLLVFDNADNLPLLMEFWPMNGIGSILITSRDPASMNRMWANSGSDLSGLDTSSAAELLQHLTSEEMAEPMEKADAVRLSERLEGHPFPLVVVARLLRERGMSVEEFLEFSEERAFLAEIYNSTLATEEDQAKRTFFDVWSFDKMESSRPEAMALLKVLAFMDADGIAESILVPEKDISLPPSYPKTQDAYVAARDELVKGSLIKRDRDKDQLTIHRLVQEAVIARMSEEDLRVNFTGLVLLITEAWPFDPAFKQEIVRWAKCTLVIPHIERALEHYEKVQGGEVSEDVILKLSKVLIAGGWYQLQKGNYEEVPRFARPALRLAEEFTSETALLVQADAHFCLCAVLTWLREAEEGRQHADKCLAIREALTPDGTSLPLAIAIDEVGHFHLLDHEYETGLGLELKAVVICETLEGRFEHGDPRREDFMATFPRYCAAISLIKLGRLQEAEDMVMSMWVRDEEHHGMANDVTFNTGLSMSLLGSIRTIQERFDEGYDLHSRSLQQFRRTIGNRHPHTGNGLVRIADHLIRLGDHDLANERLEEAINIWKNRPSFAPEMARAISKQSRVQALIGNPIRAKGLELKAQSILKAFARKKRKALSPVVTEPDYDRLVSFWAWY